MKLLPLVLSAATLAAPLATAQSTAPPAANQRVQWFSDAKFGMFVHWGLYSLLAGSWNGHTLPDKSLPNGNSWYAEWAQKRLEVPDADYAALAKQFNPVNFDADAWILEAKRAGMRYFVITSKHHDGFALWDSAATDFDMGMTQYKGDILGDLAKACRKHGVKLGFYYSHWQDWHHAGGARPFWEKDKQPTQEQFDSYWNKITMVQITELIDRYDPDLFWFDTWDQEAKDHITPERRDQLIRLIRTKSPRCLINGRICYHNPGDDIDFLETGDNEHPTKNLGKPWQTPATLCNTWGWHANDFNWKSSRTITGLLAQNISLGGNYLLNVGPKPDGTFPPAAIRILRETGGWTEANKEAIYGVKTIDNQDTRGARLTRRELPGGGSRIYAFLTEKSVKSVTLPVAASAVSSVKVLESGAPVEFKAGAKGKTTIATEKLAAGDQIPVIAVDVKP